MHRIDTPTAQKDKFGHGKNGFTRGNPQTGTPATQIDYSYCDAIQEEIANVIESKGVTLDKSKHDQLKLAIQQYVIDGKVQLSSATNSTAEDQAATPLAVKNTYDLAESANNKIDDLKQKFNYSNEYHQTEMRAPSQKNQFLVRDDGVVGLFSLENNDFLWAFSRDKLFKGLIDSSQIITLQNLNENGFIRLHGGIILQWVTAVTNEWGALDVTLPISFTSKLLSVFITEASAENWTDDGLYSYGYSSHYSNQSTIRVHSRCAKNGGEVVRRSGRFSLLAVGY